MPAFAVAACFAASLRWPPFGATTVSNGSSRSITATKSTRSRRSTPSRRSLWWTTLTVSPRVNWTVRADARDARPRRFASSSRHAWRAPRRSLPARASSIALERRRPCRRRPPRYERRASRRTSLTKEQLDRALPLLQRVDELLRQHQHVAQCLDVIGVRLVFRRV